MVKKKSAGRPGATSREEILVAATHLLKGGGAAALSIRKLAEQLGVSATSIYNYYANKQALITALGERLLDLSLDEITDDQTPAEQLTHLLNRLRAQALEQPSLIAFFNSVLPAHRMVEAIRVLAVPIKTQIVDEGEAIRQAQSLLWMVLGFTLFETNAKETGVVEQFVDTNTDILDTVKHLDIHEHDRLWQETVKRNVAGIFGEHQ